MTTVITFDVDGTLITSEGQNANRLHKLAFAHAWRTVFNFNGDIDEVQHHVRVPHTAFIDCPVQQTAQFEASKRLLTMVALGRA